ncbi:hypothetical protein PHAVU_011G167700 [Phaseolus vulgaris]|uniref:Uncharacterized protein n=1 Tax=Phaseolus vulgaris TaxID=3885 RepID=V7AMD6_PHAVU|nr:hypothetical protein PHAVU_011G167700g [Phaseolus vulgaris]ESW05291.1 hypothetical protein PHAVU_011G167700g [Phaseolus vulgaris]
MDSIPFVETQLHIAARAGHIQFVNEIMLLKSSFSWKFNPQGLRPVHLALQQGHIRIVLDLVKMDKELVRAKRRGGLILLHLASQLRDITLLAVFLEACPDSVKDFTVRSETALHLYERFEVFEFLFRWLKTKIDIDKLQTILNQRDVEGNTILHIATTRNDTKVNSCLYGFSVVAFVENRKCFTSITS